MTDNVVLPVIDEHLRAMRPGDKITYWSTAYKKWMDAELEEYRWNEKGLVMKVRTYFTNQANGNRYHQGTTILRNFDGVRRQF